MKAARLISLLVILGSALTLLIFFLVAGISLIRETQSLSRIAIEGVSRSASLQITSQARLLKSHLVTLTQNSEFAKESLLAGANFRIKNSFEERIKTRFELERFTLFKSKPTHVGLFIEPQEDSALLSLAFPIQLHGESLGWAVMSSSLSKLSPEMVATASDQIQIRPATLNEFHLALSPEIYSPVPLTVAIGNLALRAQTQSLARQALWATLFSLLALGALVYLSIHIFLIKPLNRFVAEVGASSKLLDSSAFTIPEFPVSQILEIRTLQSSFVKYAENLFKAHRQLQFKSKTELLGQVSAQIGHDLSHLITSLELRMDVETLPIPDKQKQEISEQIKRLRTAGDGIVSKLKSPPQAKQTDITQVLNELSEEKTAQWSNGPKLSIKNLPSSLFVSGDSLDWYLALTNLLQNAQEACGEQGKIEVEATQNEHELRIQIRDNGPGMPEAIKSSWGLPGSTHGKTNGNGLGLSGAKRFVESLSGTLTIQSTSGRGTEITLLVPCPEGGES